MLKLASWNVNSLKIRLEHVLLWMETNNIDILALQETKLINEAFPHESFLEKNYHVYHSGQKTYNGVAIISRYPLADFVLDFPSFEDHQRRILAATMGNLRLINLYVPNGESLSSVKYQYKLEWLKHLQLFIQQQLRDYPNLIVVGDFNIAPEDRDIYSPEEFVNSVLASPQEREAFQQLLQAGLVDSFRLFEQTEKLYSWWDYRAASFRRNRGLRIDHILLNSNLAKTCVSSQIDKTPRKWERPSDHAPVWVELDHLLR